MRISTESTCCVGLQLTTVVLIDVTLNHLNDRIVNANITRVGEELRTCCRHSSESTMVSGHDDRVVGAL